MGRAVGEVWFVVSLIDGRSAGTVTDARKQLWGTRVARSLGGCRPEGEADVGLLTTSDSHVQKRVSPVYLGWCDWMTVQRKGWSCVGLTAVCLIGVVLAVVVPVTAPQLQGTAAVLTLKLIGLTGRGGSCRDKGSILR